MNKKLIICISVFALSLTALFSACAGDDDGEGKRQSHTTKVAKTEKLEAKLSEPEVRYKVRLFLENSGSMDGYMHVNSELRNAIYYYVSSLESDTAELNFINAAVIPFAGSIEQFKDQLSPAAFAKSGGQRGSTDLKNILQEVINRTNDTTVTIFISDCILALPKGHSADYFSETEIGIKAMFGRARKQISDFAVEVLKMESSFNGKCYHQDGTATKNYNGKRPYYIWIMGSRRALAKMNRDLPLKELEKYGMKDYIVFTPDFEIPFKLYDAKFSKPSNAIAKGDWLIKAELGETLLSEDYLLSTVNWSADNAPIEIKKVTLPSRAGSSKYSLLFELTNTPRTQLVTINLKRPKASKWGDKQDNCINNLIEGVSQAYQDSEYSAHLKLNIKK